MMAVPNDGSYKLTCSFDDMSFPNDPNDPNDDETYHTPNTTDERTFAWASQSNSLPPEELAAYIWPPSVYEAAQNVYLTSLPPRHSYIPVGYHTMSVGEPWQPSLAATSSYSDRSRHLEQLQVNSRNGPDSGGLLGLSYTGLRQDSTTGNPTPPASDTANDRDTSSHIVNDKSSLRCLVCLDKPAFTGQYAQRNLNRHMAKHEPCVGQGNNRHIRCEQPGCTSTFGREDALLVHLRRSHPELNTPPAKKRKR